MKKLMKKLTSIFWFKHKRRKNRKKGRKHLQKFFNTRKKKYIYYYKKCVFSNLKVNQKLEKNEQLNHPRKKFNLGIKILDTGLLNSLPLKSLKFVSQRFMRSRKFEKYFRHHTTITPDFHLTSKPKAVRMGKGKGPVKGKVYFAKKGLVIFNIKYYYNLKSHNLNKKLFLLKLNIFLYLLLLRLKTKLPFRTTILKKNL